MCVLSSHDYFQSAEGKLASIRLDLSSVRGLSVSGQQHGTVYWAKGAGEKLDAMAADDDNNGADAGAGGSASLAVPDKEVAETTGGDRVKRSSSAAAFKVCSVRCHPRR